MTCYNTIHSKYNMSWNVDTKQEDAMKVVGLGYPDMGKDTRLYFGQVRVFSG